MRDTKKEFGTLSQTIDGLAKQGYTLDFDVRQECLVCHQTNSALRPDEFEIDAVYRFEGDSNLDDEAVVYAILSAKFGVKGVLVNAYGIYADTASNELVQKLKKHH
ncbi:MAG: phosphoribosylpyrophosphate synthetase [Chitinophagaceae bacterium]|nr:MAG: phosphoribosylpyrophosphate synthetase [Chitinophagaceae bacterium]